MATPNIIEVVRIKSPGLLYHTPSPGAASSSDNWGTQAGLLPAGLSISIERVKEQTYQDIYGTQNQDDKELDPEAFCYFAQADWNITTKSFVFGSDRVNTTNEKITFPGSTGDNIGNSSTFYSLFFVPLAWEDTTSPAHRDCIYIPRVQISLQGEVNLNKESRILEFEGYCSPAQWTTSTAFAERIFSWGRATDITFRTVDK